MVAGFAKFSRNSFYLGRCLKCDWYGNFTANKREREKERESERERERERTVCIETYRREKKKKVYINRVYRKIKLRG